MFHFYQPWKHEFLSTLKNQRFFQGVLKWNIGLKWINWYFVMPYITEAVTRKCSVKKVFLKISQNLQENICARVSFLIKLQASACNFIKKETLTQMFSCEFCKIFKSTIFYRTLRWPPPTLVSTQWNTIRLLH